MSKKLLLICAFLTAATIFPMQAAGNDSVYVKWEMLYNAVDSLYASGNYAEALLQAKECRAFAERNYGVEDTCYIPSLANEALLNDMVGNLDTAELLYTRLLELAKKVYGTENDTYAQFLNSFSQHFRVTGNYEKCERLLRQAIEITRKISGENSEPYALDLNTLGYLLMGLGRYKESEENYLISLRIISENKDSGPMLIPQVTNNIALLYEEMGRYPEAEKYYRQALKEYEEIVGQQHPLYAKGLDNLAHLLSIMGNYAEAETMHLSSLALHKQIYKEGHPEISTVEMNIGLFYERLGQYADAEKYYGTALREREASLGENHPDVALSLNQLGKLLTILDRHDEAKSMLMRALKIWSDIPGLGEKHPEYGRVLGNLAYLYLKTGILDSAEMALKKATDIDARLLGKEHPVYADILSLSGDYYEQTGKQAEAGKYFAEACQIRNKIFPLSHPMMGESYLALGRHYKIINDTAHAAEYFSKMLQNYREQITYYFPGLSETEKACFYNVLKNNYDIYYSFVGDVAGANPRLIGDMLDNRLFTKGLLFSAEKKQSERIKRSNDSLLINKFNEWNLAKQLLSKWFTASEDKLNKTNLDIDSLTEAVKRLEKEISRKAGLFTSQSDKTYHSWKEIRDKLKKDDAAVEIIRVRYFGAHYTNEVRYYALIVTAETKEAPELIILQHGNELEGSSFEQYRNAVMNLQQDSISFSSFWKQIYEKTKEKKRVYLSPDGVYFKINIETLELPGRKSLFDLQEIHTLTSMNDLLVADTSRRKTDFSSGFAVLMGFPNYKLSGQRQTELSNDFRSGRLRGTRGVSLKLSPVSADYFRSVNFITTRGLKVVKSNDNLKFSLNELPGTKIEVDKIMDIIGASKCSVDSYVDELALEEVAKSVESPKILHIATHGYFLEDISLPNGSIMGIASAKFRENPLLRSGLFLAGATRETNTGQNTDTENQTEDGILTSFEAMNLNLDNTELVVLSACETGLGAVVNGEGVLGLQRAFKIAGAKSVIMSLWKVDDAATQELMASFYAGWLANGDKAAAFHKARQVIKEKYKSPFYWGAFILTGE